MSWLSKRVKINKRSFSAAGLADAATGAAKVGAVVAAAAAVVGTAGIAAPGIAALAMGVGGGISAVGGKLGKAASGVKGVLSAGQDLLNKGQNVLNKAGQVNDILSGKPGIVTVKPQNPNNSRAVLTTSAGKGQGKIIMIVLAIIAGLWFLPRILKKGR